MPLRADTGAAASAHTVVTHKHTEIEKQVKEDVDIQQGKRISFPNGYLVESVSDSIKLSYNWNSAGIDVFVQIPVDVDKSTDKDILDALERADSLCAEHISRHLGTMKDMLLGINLPANTR